MLHAFRDRNMIAFSSFEEGMVRAAEIEIFNRLPGYDYSMGKHHSYQYDVYYEGLNRPSIGAQNGNVLCRLRLPSSPISARRIRLGQSALGEPKLFCQF